MVRQTLSSANISLNQFVQCIHGAEAACQRILGLWHSALHKSEGVYALCLGSTATSDIDGISAAGADGQSRRLTPAIDAEALVLGAPISAAEIPVSPAGIVSPVVISRAMLDLVRSRIKVFDCGTFVPPMIDCLDVGGKPASRLDTGRSLDKAIVERLFNRGLKAGRELADTAGFVVVGECVPAGTTTALAVLTGLQYPAAELVSSSMPRADRELRNRLVEDGLARSGAQGGSPLDVVAAVGDPMQPFVAGLLLGASPKIPVILGGGTQMLAVYALAQAILGEILTQRHFAAVVTTKWVAFDPHAGAEQLARLVQAPFAAACPDFNFSRHAGLQAYEAGNVKEGVAAGAMMAAASLTGNSDVRILDTIDHWYDRMVLKRN